MEIIKNKDYVVNNVLIYRNKLRQEEINAIMARAEEIMKVTDSKINGPVITAVHSVKEQICDFEIIFPLDKAIESSGDFIYKEKFEIVNTLMFRHTGNPQTMNSEMEEFVRYIKENNLKPVTPFYNITVKGAKTLAEIDDMIVDIYVGIQ